jgi:hypothetical protein
MATEVWFDSMNERDHYDTYTVLDSSQCKGKWWGPCVQDDASSDTIEGRHF